MGRDANNQMYPIAWAIVKVENTKNWCWFLSLSHDDLNLQQIIRLTLLSDSHRGLLEAVGDWLPNAEHIKCTRHVYANFKRKYSGLQLQRLFFYKLMDEEDIRQSMKHEYLEGLFDEQEDEG
ncbi:lipopolysaccharide-modifying protein [Tanacetum coccineum]